MKTNSKYNDYLFFIFKLEYKKNSKYNDYVIGEADTSYMRTGSRKRGCSRGRALANGLWWAGGQIAGLWWYNSLSPFGDVLEW